MSVSTSKRKIQLHRAQSRKKRRQIEFDDDDDDDDYVCDWDDSMSELTESAIDVLMDAIAQENDGDTKTADEVKNDDGFEFQPEISKFQCKRKGWGLTYSAPNDGDLHYVKQHQELHPDIPVTNDNVKEIMLEPMLNDLRHTFRNHDIDKYILAAETHRNGKFHVHVFIKFTKTLRVTTPRKFDLHGDHPNILKGNPGLNWETYCRKDGTYISNYEPGCDWNGAWAMAKEGKVDQAYALIISNYPRDAALNGDKIKANFQSAAREIREQETRSKTTTYNISQFTWPQLTDFSKAVCLVGAAGIGKTSFAKAHFKNALLVRTKDRLRDFDAGIHDGIILDDPGFMHKMTREQIIALLDMQDSTTVECRYRDAYIPAGTPRVLTFNFGHVHIDFGDAAIARRVTRIDLSTDGRVNGDNSAAAAAAYNNNYVAGFTPAP